MGGREKAQPLHTERCLQHPADPHNGLTSFQSKLEVRSGGGLKSDRKGRRGTFSSTSTVRGECGDMQGLPSSIAGAGAQGSGLRAGSSCPHCPPQ